MLCCGYTLTDFPISIRLTSLTLWQSNDCSSASKATLMNMDNYFMWIHYERLHNHNKAKHNKTVCMFLGIYCRTAPSSLLNHLFFHSPYTWTWLHYPKGPTGASQAQVSFQHHLCPSIFIISAKCFQSSSKLLSSTFPCSFTNMLQKSPLLPKQLFKQLHLMNASDCLWCWQPSSNSLKENVCMSLTI